MAALGCSCDHHCLLLSTQIRCLGSGMALGRDGECCVAHFLQSPERPDSAAEGRSCAAQSELSLMSLHGWGAWLV